MQKYKWIWGAVIAITLMISWQYWPEQPQKLPNLTLTSLQEEAVQLSNFEGQPMIVSFWATSCATCIQEIPLLEGLYQKYHTRGLTVVMVAMQYDPLEYVRRFQQKRQLPMVMWKDTSGLVAQQYQVRATPTILLINRQGKVVSRRVGRLPYEAFKTEVADLLS